MKGRTYPRYRCDGCFYGRRVNCERVPMLPALAVREVLDDPRKIPYLLVWKNDDGEIKEAARVISLGPIPYLPTADSVEIKRTDGSVRPYSRNQVVTSEERRICDIAGLSLLLLPAPRAIRMGARRTIFDERPKVQLAVPQVRQP